MGQKVKRGNEFGFVAKRDFHGTFLRQIFVLIRSECRSNGSHAQGYFSASAEQSGKRVLCQYFRYSCGGALAGRFLFFCSGS